ncbi:MAG TPA: ChbG/HpnK family deacetylase, partial [Ignavibacteriaceae bacterium]
MKLLLILLFAISLIQTSSFTQSKEETKTLLIRCDDLGMSHAVNAAFKELMESGLKFSASVMFP